MQATLAIARLAIKSALRYRVFVVLALLIVGIVAGIPLIVKHDGTARGLAQITLTYTLGSVTVLLGFATLWIACGSIAREAAEAQLQMVDVKPIARWQVWLGKWLGIMAINTVLLAFSAAGAYGLLLWRTNSLDAKQRYAMQQEVLIARGSAKEEATDFDSQVERLLATDAMKQQIEAGADRDRLAALLRNDLVVANQNVPPNNLRRWTVNLGNIRERLGDVPLRIRFRFYSADGGDRGATYPLEWTVGPLDRARLQVPLERYPGAAFHEFELPAGLVNDRGELIIDCANRSLVNLVFQLEDGLEVVYREGGFGPNLVRAGGILLCWLALLTTIGLASGSGLSFPVATFVAFTALVVGLSSGTLADIVEQGVIIEAEHSHEAEADAPPKKTVVDIVGVAVFRALLSVISVVKDFSPIESLSAGRHIPWLEVMRAFGIVVVGAGGVFALVGVGVFHKRELALAAGRS
jgi:hypothetical protein